MEPSLHVVVGAILNGDPLPQQEALPSEEEVAEHQEADDLPIVLDADSTQYAALLGAKKGASIVINGPPGSGKSQTIANLIAIALAQGKKVLFVAQKLPALEVVRRRLETVEIAPFCLPLFSDKARVTEMHILKIVELIVSGRIPQRAHEDYFVTACRLVVQGASGVQVSAATKRVLDKALDEIKRSDRRARPDIVEMRAWRGRRAVTRSILLLTSVEKVIGSRELTKWLERSNPNLGRRTPVDLIRAGDWLSLADFLDDMLTGSPT